MRCTKCGEALGAAAYTVDLLLGDDHFTINLHQRCMRELVGDRATNALNAMGLKSGWVNYVLPGFEEKRA